MYVTKHSTLVVVVVAVVEALGMAVAPVDKYNLRHMMREVLISLYALLLL